MTAREWLILHSCRLFRGFDDAETDAALLFFDAEKKFFEKGQLIHRPDEPMSRFGLVLEGNLSVTMDDLDGNQVLMASVTPGETYGESLCFLETKDPPVTVTAAEDSTVLFLRTDALKRVPMDAPEIGMPLYRRFTEMLAERTLRMNDRVQILSRPLLRDKLTTFFAQCEHHYGSKTFRVPFDRAGMALYLGVNRSALSRELSDMQAEGLIDFYRNSFRIL